MDNPNQTDWFKNKALKESITAIYDSPTIKYDDPAVRYDGYDTDSEAFEDAPNTPYTKRTPNQTGHTKRTPDTTPWT